MPASIPTTHCAIWIVKLMAIVHSTQEPLPAPDHWRGCTVDLTWMLPAKAVAEIARCEGVSSPLPFYYNFPFLLTKLLGGLLFSLKKTRGGAFKNQGSWTLNCCIRHDTGEVWLSTLRGAVGYNMSLRATLLSFCSNINVFSTCGDSGEFILPMSSL